MKWITIRDAAAIARLSKRMVYAAVERKELRASRIGTGRNLRTTEEWVNAWLSATATGGPRTSEPAAGTVPSHPPLCE